MIGKPTLRISNTIEYTGQSMNNAESAINRCFLLWHMN
jgi:hypothetical protein